MKTEIKSKNIKINTLLIRVKSLEDLLKETENKLENFLKEND